MCKACDSKDVLSRLSKAQVAHLKKSARAAAKIESRYARAIEQKMADFEDELAKALIDGRKPPKPPDFEFLLLQNAHDAMAAGLNVEPKIPSSARHNLAKKKNEKLPEVKIPSNPAALRQWWDLVRKDKAPARIQALEKKIKKAYIAKVQSIWDRAAEAFRAGNKWTQEEVKIAMKEATKVGANRARIIVSTETTRYFNEARRAYYDEQPTVTHYLFVAIRDSRTTRWCKTRHGLVYEKGSSYLTRETPPIHYQCRSEMVPLSPFNPEAQRLIKDKSKARANNHPAPLLPGWNSGGK